MKATIKKFLCFVLVIFCLTLSGCYKEDSLDFMQGQYSMKQSEAEQYSLDGIILEDASIILFRINKDSYNASNKINVLENRYSKEYYSVSFKMELNGTEYNDIQAYEYEGSSAYPNCYFLRIKFDINDKSFDCKLRLEFLKYNWEYQGNENEGNYIACTLSPVVGEEKNGDTVKLLTHGNYGYFYLSYNPDFTNE